MKQHNATIDFMRAILIALMILIHIVNFGTLYPGVKDCILAFLMPSFLVITGYLVNPDKTAGRFGLYLLRIALPYIIMVTGFMVMSLYLPVRGGIERFDLPTVCRVLFVTSIGPYWFLHAMIVCGTVYYACHRLTGKTRLDTVSRISILAAALILVAEFTPFLSLRNAAYYFVGIIIKMCFGDFSKVYRSSLLPIAPFALLIARRDLHDWGTIAMLACVLCFLSLSAWLEEKTPARLQKALCYIGRNTLPIYVFHPVFTMLAKRALPLFAFDTTGLVHAFVTIVFSIAGSIAIGLFMDRTRLSYAFGKRHIMR